ncbi:cytochrome c oxidase assembly protein [Clavibacter sp. VKM Ac-2542]|uniref:cytochrome c oxidase assembly protein n=1 Tax=Clavibacter sp. VKM Ac-2542 TaxID=2783811 RepID=UPI00188A7491|nr:cytochrome c oxidase assembly protein [Clavibacter sp. VKM Ac-2542]MBF4621446.1 cytochrome c oxidase assembly protein [Clavibacter sp. VKM Ac-2542]
MIPVAIVVTTVLLLGDGGYTAIGRGYPGMATSMTSAMLRLVAVVAGALCLGALTVALFVVPRTGRDRMRVHSGVDLMLVRWSAGAWSAAAAALAVVDASDANGVPLSRAMEPGALAYLAQASYLPAAWIVTALLALVIFCAAHLIDAWTSTLALAGISVVAVLAPVLVGQVLVGPDHDFGGDAAIFAEPAMSAWLGATVTVLARWRSTAMRSPMARSRFVRLSLVCAGMATAGQLVIAAFELAGGSPWETATGVLFLVRFALLAALGVVGGIAWRRRRRDTSAEADAGRPLVAAGTVLLLVSAGVSVAMLRIPPPQYFVPTSIMELFLGFDVTPAPTPAVLVGAWRLNILFAVLSAAAVVSYLLGVRRLRRRGDAWPRGRTVVWILGWLVVFVTTSSGLGKYSSVSFSLHMLLHMSLNMLGPLLLVMAAPVTLALRAIPPRRRGEPAAAHEWITGLVNWSVTRTLLNPLWVFVSFVGSYYLIYLTPIFQEAMRYHWSHQLMNLHFLIGGYLFYSLVIGADHPPRPLPHIGKLGLVLAAMPFHAFFGVIIMTSTTVIAETFYAYVDAPWMTDLAGDQYLGGGIAWSAGELPLIVVVIALVTQWARQDARSAARTDRHLDSGLDDSFDAYNEMLTRLSDRAPIVLTGATPTKEEDR